jgi:hypothetical protein
MRMGPRWTPRADGLHEYEERITIWRANSFDDAIAKAEMDAREYAEDIEVNYLGTAQAYAISDSPEELDGAEVFSDGSEVFSLLRPHRLLPDEYIDQYIETSEYRHTEKYRHKRTPT